MGFRIGIDVGGTFTKAVVLDPATGSLTGKASVLTTHGAEEGVARGAVEALQQVLARTGLAPSAVELVVLSTTQAVNALLEGDVEPVGVLGMGPRRYRADSFRRTRLGNVPLGPGRSLVILHRFVETDHLEPDGLREALESLVAGGARALVASAAYAVEDPGPERRALEVARELGVPATAGHEMSGLYGLQVRTYTAAINASILPKMMAVLRWVEASMRQAGIRAPLMVMHGDLDVVPLEEARRRPAFTVLSGPAASVAGASLYHRVLDGLFMEVGGTSTNVGVLRRGRPVMRYVTIMDHPTCLRSVDVRVAGVAGGSLVRVGRRRLVEVGPRSAHIAGLPYPSFSPPSALRRLRLVTLAPRPGDPADYAAVENDRGERFALTLTDAANALGLVPEGDYARGSQESARLALAPLAARLGVSVERVAQGMLEMAARRIRPILEELRREYRLGRVTLLGLGGGASVLLPFVARRLGLAFRIVPHAEVIASVGAAMTPAGLELERHLDGQAPETLVRWAQEAKEAAVTLGAAPERARVVVEPVPERRAVRLRAVGPAGGGSGAPWAASDPASARRLAAEALRLPEGALRPVFDNGFYRVFEGEWHRGFGPWRRPHRALAVVDGDGAVLFACRDALLWRQGASPDGGPSAAREGPEPPGAARFGPAPELVAIAGSCLVRLPAGRAGGVEPLLRELGRAFPGKGVLVLAGRSEEGMA